MQRGKKLKFFSPGSYTALFSQLFFRLTAGIIYIIEEVLSMEKPKGDFRSPYSAGMVTGYRYQTHRTMEEKKNWKRRRNKYTKRIRHCFSFNSSSLQIELVLRVQSSKSLTLTLKVIQLLQLFNSRPDKREKNERTESTSAWVFYFFFFIHEIAHAVHNIVCSRMQTHDKMEKRICSAGLKTITL